MGVGSALKKAGSSALKKANCSALKKANCTLENGDLLTRKKAAKRSLALLLNSRRVTRCRKSIIYELLHILRKHVIIRRWSEYKCLFIRFGMVMCITDIEYKRNRDAGEGRLWWLDL